MRAFYEYYLKTVDGEYIHLFESNSPEISIGHMKKYIKHLTLKVGDEIIRETRITSSYIKSTDVVGCVE